MDLDSGDVTEEMIDDLTMEFPKIDPRRQGKKQRYGYSLATPNRAEGQVTFDGIARRDFDSGEVEQHSFDGRYWIDEPTFIPDSDDAGEGEGWLVSYAFNRETHKSELLVVDATDISAGPVARVLLPRRVPHGFHGTWSPG
jgi:carotenoid cleavage dioxygenase